MISIQTGRHSFALSVTGAYVTYGIEEIYGERWRLVEIYGNY
jgi:hypothetical protein